MARKDDHDDVNPEAVEKFRVFLADTYLKELHKAAEEGRPLLVDFGRLDRYPDVSQMLLDGPERFFKVAEEAVKGIDLPSRVKIRFTGLPESSVVNIRDLRSRHIGKLIMIEGTVKRASEIRPEIVAVSWRCHGCGFVTHQPVKGPFVSKPFRCLNATGGRDGGACDGKSFEEDRKVMIDARWLTIEEPFELTEGEKPSQVNVWLSEDLVSVDGRRMTDPGNRLKIVGVLRDIPKAKMGSTKLDFFLDANSVEPTETTWARLKISKEDKEKIKALAAEPGIYEKLIDSLAPSLYGLSSIKESIILQLFGGVARNLPDGTKFRGDIHILIIGDPSSGKSQLLKLVPEIVPRGRYVSGKGVTGAGLCMAYDTLVPSAHGEIRKIGDIVEEALKTGSRRIKDGVNDGYVSDSGDFEIVCMDEKTLRMKKMRVSNFFKLRPSGGLVTLRTRTGRQIKLTPENPVLVMRNGDVAWKQAREIESGEHIALARYLPVNHLPVEEDTDFARFLGMVAGDGDIGSREIRFHNGSERYLDSFSGICSELGYKPRKYYQKNRVACVRVASKSLCDKVESMGMPRGKKAGRTSIPRDVLISDRMVSEFLSGIFDCDGCVVDKGNGSYVEYTTVSRTLAQQIQTCMLRFGIMTKVRERAPAKKGFGGKLTQYQIIVRGRENLEAFGKHIGFTCEKKEKLGRVLSRKVRPNTNIDVIPGVGPRLADVRKALGIKVKNDRNLYLLRHYEHGRRDFTREQLLRFAGFLRQKKECDYFRFLEKLARSDIFWDEVASKKDAREEWVYDLTVEGEHNFIANDVIVHNTATVTKDEQFMGGWVLEAGALVLTNKGLLSIDEFEKMNEDDQVAMHEALEQGTISIAKASIIATLPAKTSVLAGGNPKFSRFDPMRSISEQIDIPPTLLSRFDLKFTLRDVPDAKKDRKIVEHVMKSRHEGEQMMPAIPQDLVRKYVAYAKENTSPQMSPEVSKLLKNFYVKTRARAEGGGPVPITLRQFEGLLRLSEASAKVRLSDTITKDDANRAIRLMKESLKDLGYDAESGEIDVDRSEGATSFSERSKITRILNLIDQLSGDRKEIVQISKLRELAVKEGIESSEIDEIIERLKRDGVLFEPNPGYVQRP